MNFIIRWSNDSTSANEEEKLGSAKHLVRPSTKTSESKMELLDLGTQRYLNLKKRL